MTISLSTNVDLQNYQGRIGQVVRAMNPLGIEIFTIPQNYPFGPPTTLPDTQPESRFPLLSKYRAKDLGQKLRGLKRLQLHYPWQKTPLDSNGRDMALTIQFCDIVLEESGAKQLTINSHNLHYPLETLASKRISVQRKNILNMFKYQAWMVQQIKKELGSQCLLSTENNSPISEEKDGVTSIDYVDIVPEDFMIERSVEAVTLDFSHALNTVSQFGQRLREYPPNIVWCYKQYCRIPESAKSLEAFVKAMAPRLKWLHIADEKAPFTLHKGLHPGDGDADFRIFAAILRKHLTDDLPVTIEVKGGHTPEELERILNHDYPLLSKIFNK